MKSENLLYVTVNKRCSQMKWQLITLGTACTAAGNRSVTIGGEGLEVVVDSSKDITNSLWHASNQVVVVEFKNLQLVQFLESKWDFSCEVVIVHPYSSKLEKVSHFSRDISIDLGVGDGKGCKVLKRSNFSRDSSGDVISIKPHGNCNTKSSM